MSEKGYQPQRGIIGVASAVVYAVVALATAALVWLLAAELRVGAYDWAVLWGLLAGVLLAGAAGWLAVAGVLRAIIDGAEELDRLHRTTRAASDRQAQMLADVIERLDGLAHWTAMSEATRSLLSRKRENEVFLKQIETSLGEGDWAESERLIAMYQQHFADPATAGQLRQKMNSAREVADDRVIRSRISEIRTMIDQHNFPAAEMALSRLGNDYPQDRRLDDLRSTFTRARRRHSETAQEKFRQLLAERKLEEASALLDQLTWLDVDTVQGLRDRWREGFRQGQHEARQQFTTAVKEKQWLRAAGLGEQILQRYSNTVLAGEVRKHIDTIRQRARELSSTDQTAGPADKAPPAEKVSPASKAIPPGKTPAGEVKT